VRRVLIAGVAVMFGSLGLAGCGSSSLSYGIGYSVGQSLAAGASGFTASHATIVAACERQWRVSGSNIDSHRQWVNGCVRGFIQVEAEVTNTTNG
jgi:hypothetical protein